MRLLMLGASGRTGRLVVKEALTQGYTVTALVRKASSLEAQELLTIVEGTSLNSQDIETAFNRTPEDPIRGVVVTLAVPRESDSPFSKPVAAPYLIRDSVQNAMAVMRAHGVRKLAVMSLVGVGDSWDNFAWLWKAVFTHTQMSWVLQDHNAVDALVHGSEGIDWTLVRAPMLKDGEAKPVREFEASGKGIRMLDTVTRASVAEFMSRVMGSSTWDKKAVAIVN